MKTFTVVRVELGVVEAESLEQAIEISNNEGFNCGYSSEKVLDENDKDNDFWANLNVDRIESLKDKFDFNSYVKENYRISIMTNGCYVHDLINKENVLIDDKIFDEELFEYRIVDREDFIEDLIGWISEAKNGNKNLMMEDLKELMTWEDDYIFSSISTNEYFSKKDSGFDELCKELIELNKSL